MGQRHHRWVGYVKSLPGVQWSDYGDSGALVYALRDSVKIPLGFHVGNPDRMTSSRWYLVVALMTLLLLRRSVWDVSKPGVSPARRNAPSSFASPTDELAGALSRLEMDNYGHLLAAMQQNLSLRFDEWEERSGMWLG
jgi:hypothetical protein